MFILEKLSSKPFKITPNIWPTFGVLTKGPSNQEKKIGQHHTDIKSM